MEDFKEMAIREHELDYEDEMYNDLHPLDDNEEYPIDNELTAEEEDFVLEVGREQDYDRKGKKFSEMTEITIQRLVELDMIRQSEVNDELKQEIETELRYKYGDLD